jgi:hypothetical protein
VAKKRFNEALARSVDTVVLGQVVDIFHIMLVKVHAPSRIPSSAIRETKRGQNGPDFTRLQTPLVARQSEAVIHISRQIARAEGTDILARMNEDKKSQKNGILFNAQRL